MRVVELMNVVEFSVDLPRTRYDTVTVCGMGPTPPWEASSADSCNCICEKFPKSGSKPAACVFAPELGAETVCCEDVELVVVPLGFGAK